MSLKIIMEEKNLDKLYKQILDFKKSLRKEMAEE